MTPRKRCKHAGRPSGPANRRPCALGLFGGTVRKQRECQTCDQWEALGDQSPPKEGQTKELIQLGVKKLKSGEPCDHFTALTGTEREQYGKGHTKKWGHCGHKYKPLRGEAIVCPCTGCGPRCTGYTNGEEESINDVEENES